MTNHFRRGLCLFEDDARSNQSRIGPLRIHTLTPAARLSIGASKNLVIFIERGAVVVERKLPGEHHHPIASCRRRTTYVPASCPIFWVFFFWALTLLYRYHNSICRTSRVPRRSWKFTTGFYEAVDARSRKKRTGKRKFRLGRTPGGRILALGQTRPQCYLHVGE